MSGLLLHDSSCSENEFLAEEYMISVVPFIAHPAFHFISGTFGPLQVDVEVKLPLWLAISLCQKKKCRIIIPDWLSVEFLQQKVIEERTSSSFQEMEFYYIEIALLLFERYTIY